MSAIGMLTFLLATGMAVDLGHFYLVKSELQNAADAAALAGASALNSGPTGIAEATRRATAAMNGYEFNSKGLAITNANVKFAVNLAGPYVDAATASAGGTVQKIRFVKVETPDVPVNVFFAAPVLGGSKNMRAEATAGMSLPITSVCDFLPVSVIDYGVPMQPGQTYTFRAAPAGTVSPGNYQLLAVAGNGGQDVRVGIASGVDACAAPGEEYAVDTKTGVTAGPVRVGINTRFDDYGTSQVDPVMQPPDKNIQENINYSQYIAGSPSTAPSHPGVAGRRVVIIPIVKQSEYDPGRGVVKFNRFGLFFLQNKAGNGSGGDLVAEYIDKATVVGRGRVGTGAAAANGFLAKPVLYR
jgi:Flp pilus assembly protein TadG